MKTFLFILFASGFFFTRTIYGQEPNENIPNFVEKSEPAEPKRQENKHPPRVSLILYPAFFREEKLEPLRGPDEQIFPKGKRKPWNRR